MGLCKGVIGSSGIVWKKLEDPRAEFRTKIVATVNESKSCEFDGNRDAEEIRRDH